jgi:sugar/nucleoside kinase (ribokinase family)
VVKRGADGALWSDGIEARSAPALAVRAVDSTGAGDAFAAGYLACAGDTDAKLAAAARLAALAVAGVGGRPEPPVTT